MDLRAQGETGEVLKRLAQTPERAALRKNAIDSPTCGCYELQSNAVATLARRRCVRTEKNRGMETMESDAMRKLLEKLEEGEAIVGTMVGASYDPTILHTLKMAGFEFVVIDTQHSIQNQEDLRAYAAEGVYLGLPVWIRPQYSMRQFITRPLDNGVTGIMAPMVGTPEQAREIVDAAFYPPIGIRSYGAKPIAVAGRQFGRLQDRLDYINANTAVFAQIETVEGIENLPQIMAIDGVFGTIVGPNDLAVSLGLVDVPYADVFEHNDYEAAMEEILQRCQEAGKYAGVHFMDRRLARHWMERGYKVIMVGTDSTFLAAGAKSYADYIRGKSQE